MSILAPSHPISKETEGALSDVVAHALTAGDNATLPGMARWFIKDITTVVRPRPGTVPVPLRIQQLTSLQVAGALLVALVLIGGAIVLIPTGPTAWENLLGPQDAGDGSPGVTDTTPTTAETVADTEAPTPTDTVTEPVETPVENEPPSADAGPDQTATAADTVALNASNTTDPDDEFDQLGFDWRQSAGPGVELEAADTAQPSFTAPDVETERTLQFVLVVTDTDGTNDTDVVNVTVRPVLPDDMPSVTDTEATQTGDSDSTDESDSDSTDGTDEIDTCTVIDEPGQYTLTSNLEHAAAGACIKIASSDVDLDGAGHTIDGTEASDSVGVLATGTEEVPLSNVTVRNLTLADLVIGVEYDWTNDGHISEVTATNNRAGIRLNSSSEHRLARNELVENDRAGLVLRGTGSHHNTIERNEVSDNGQYGIYLVDSRHNHLTANAALDNGEWDYYASDNAVGNEVERLELSTATVSFDGRDVSLRAVEQLPTAPDGYDHIDQFVEATGTDDDAWLTLTVHYADSDVEAADLDESTLRMWRHDDAWAELSSPNQVDTGANTVTANVTQLDGVVAFAPLGEPDESAS